MIDDQNLEDKPIKHIINEMQLILSEKRTALSVLRTGITVLLFPLSVLTVLLATSRYYNITQQLKYAIPLAVICLGFVILGIYLIVRATRQIKKYDYAAGQLLRHSDYLRDLLDFKE
jgi:uncharacterized protein YybS (DUF2232 family)